MDNRTRPRRLGWRRAATWLALAVVAVAWALLLREQLAALGRYEWALHWPSALAAVGAAVLYFGLLAGGWARLLQQMGAPSQFFVAVRAWLISMFARYLPGNVWHILARAAFADELASTPSQVIASATIEQGLTLLGAGLLALICLPLGLALPSAEWLLLIIPLGVAALHPAILGRLIGLVAQRLKRPELAWNYRYRDILRLLGWYLSANACAGIALVLIVAGLTPISMANAVPLVGAAAAAWLIGYLSLLTPSGLGVREGVLVALLSPLMPLPVAIVASLLHRLALTIGEVLLSGSFALMRRPP